MGTEIAILEFIQEHLRCDFLDAVVPHLTALGNGGWVWIALCAVMLIFPKTRRVGCVMALALALEALCCNVILKPLVERIRPFDVNEAAELLIAEPGDFSFPSGHTGAAFAVAAALWFERKRLPWGRRRKILCAAVIILAFAMGISRIYLYVHYPTDVLAGAALGILAAWVSKAVIDKVERRVKLQRE